MKTERGKAPARRGLAGGIYKGVLFAVLLGAGLGGPGLAQVPDNRGPRLDPEDSVPPAYRDTLDERDRQRLDAARAAGETFIPVILGPGTAPAAAAAGPAPARAAPTPPRPAYEGYRQPEPAAPRASGGDERAAGDLRPEGLRPEGLIGVLIESWTRPPEIVRLRYRGTPWSPAAAARDPDAATYRTEEKGGGRDARTAGATLPRIPAGRGLYARTLYAVDSDYPGPVLLELLEPPLAGAVATGAFTLVRERLVLRLTRLEYRGRSVPVDAWGVGLDCACYGVEGEVDSHWFSRVLLPSAVRFAEGFLTALSRPSETVIVGDGVRYERLESSTREAVHAGLAGAARTAGEVLLENAPDGPTVRIPRDTEMVVVFAAPPGGPEESGQDGSDG